MQFEIIKANGGTATDKKSGIKYKYQRYEMRSAYGSPAVSDYLKKKFIRRWLSFGAGRRHTSKGNFILTIRRPYQYPGFRVTFNNGFRVVFTEVSVYRGKSVQK